MNFRGTNNQDNAVLPHSVVKMTKGALLAFTFILAFSMNTAWSYESYMDPLDLKEGSSTEAPKTEINLLSDAAAMCKPLLKSNQHTSSTSANVRSQRAAGKVAALGMILGARFALEPKDDTHHLITQRRSQVRISQGRVIINDRSALAIAAYRNCQKEYVLSQL